MPKIGMRLRVRLGAQLPLDLIPDGDAVDQIDNLAARWRGDCGISGNFWSDKTGTYVLDGTGHLPTTNPANANLNNQATTVYNGTTQYFSGAAGLASALEGSSAATVFAVGERGATGAYHTIASVGDSAGANNYIWYAIDSGNKLFYRRLDTLAGDDLGNTSTLAVPFYSTFVYTGTQSQLYLNGSTDGSPASITKAPTSTDFFTIGALRRSTVNNFFSGELAEVIVYSRELSTAEIATVHGYIQARYAL